MQETAIALLRGINVGGKNKLPMQELVKIVQQADCTDIKTYIQSGNVVFKASSALLTDLSERIPGIIQQQLGLQVPVLIRSLEELATVVQGNPFIKTGADPSSLHVMFLSENPRAEGLARLDPGRSPSDSFVVVGREIYLHCPDGLARTPLTNAYFESKLKTISTSRNWRTTLKLLELANA